VLLSQRASIKVQRSVNTNHGERSFVRIVTGSGRQRDPERTHRPGMAGYGRQRPCERRADRGTGGTRAGAAYWGGGGDSAFRCTRGSVSGRRRAAVLVAARGPLNGFPSALAGSAPPPHWRQPPPGVGPVESSTAA